MNSPFPSSCVEEPYKNEYFLTPLYLDRGAHSVMVSKSLIAHSEFSNHRGVSLITLVTTVLDSIMLRRLALGMCPISNTARQS